MNSSPIAQIAAWLKEAEGREQAEPAAMSVATVGADGRPSLRMVLLRGLDERGLVFYTNLGSRKAADIRANEHVACCLHWKSLGRQVRVEGAIGRVTRAESDEIFLARPRLSRLGALASPQSRVVSGRRPLEKALAALQQRHDGSEVHRPAHWGGYRVAADVFEFWQGRPNRLHDRLRYRRSGRRWKRDRLAP